MNKKIGYKDLSAWLKTLVVAGFVIAGIYATLFVIGFIQGLLKWV